MKQFDLFTYQDLGMTFPNICDLLGCDAESPAWPDHFGKALKNWLIDNNIPKIRTLSLFSGAGGLDIGFSDIGFDIVASVEIEKKFCETLQYNTGTGKYFEHSQVYCSDIRNFTGDNLGKIDFIIGGPPCQTFSAAGRRANGVLGTSDSRGVLFKEYVRLLKKLSPVGFLFENVYGIIGAQGGEPWHQILQAFSEIGYNLHYRVIDAADYGVPQHRERLIIVGLKQGTFKFPRPTHGPDSIEEQPFYNAEKALQGVFSNETDMENKLSGRYAHLLDAIPPGLNYSFYTEKMGHPTPVFAWRSKFSDFLYKADPNTPVRTIKASGGAYTGPLHWNNRFFKYEEYKRLQSFPDCYHISGSKQIAVKQIGNSVPPQLARIMAIAVQQQVFNVKFPFELSLLDENEILTFRKRKSALSESYRKKAQKFLSNSRNVDTVRGFSRRYFCNISDNFQFEMTEEDKAIFEANIVWGKGLTITIFEKFSSSIESRMKVLITPNMGKWPLAVEYVELCINSVRNLAFTAAWKAFELELVHNCIKADIVQLNGYYQYIPKLRCKCEYQADYPFGSILKNILEGNAISKIQNTQELAEKLNIQGSDVLLVSEHLKSIGYEIRNHFTNPQIEIDNWLIPYSFPTLTPRSVQLRKKLQ